MKKLGIILRDYKSANNNDLLAFRSDLLKYLLKYKIEIICLPIDFNQEIDYEYKRIINQIEECDGIIFPGGSTIHEIDLKIVKTLHEKNIPTLGLCLGMQIMSVAFNGKITSLKTEKHQSTEKYVHEVIIKKESKLATILKETKILVNSRHNEHIINTKLDTIAFSNDLIIEAVEDKSKTFFIGLQWHPESLFYDENSRKIFDYFISTL